MRTKAQIKEQREFCKIVIARIAEMGLLHKFVAENIALSSARLSQYTSNFRQMPMKVRLDLIRYLKMESPPPAVSSAK